MLFSHSEAASIVLPFSGCWEHLSEDNAIPEGVTAQRAIQESWDLGWLPACSAEDWGFLLGPTLISILQFVVVVLCFLPASIGFTILLQWCLPNMLPLREFLSLCPSYLHEMYSETLIGHSPLEVSNASLCVLSSQDSGSPGQCLFLPQADSKYLVSLIYLKPAKQES
jgi:hypothetical protein